MVVGRKRLGTVAVLVPVCLVFAYWTSIPADDPRSIGYSLWKRGLNRNMNPETALAAFYLDTDRDQLIRGATENQLKTRFGYIRRLDQVSPYLQLCRNEGRKDKVVVFLRDSPWMVVMNNQKGSDLVLCKGY